MYVEKLLVPCEIDFLQCLTQMFVSSDAYTFNDFNHATPF